MRTWEESQILEDGSSVSKDTADKETEMLESWWGS